MNTAIFLSYRVRIRGSRGTNPRISRNEFEALVERIRGSGGANPRILWNESADLGEQIRSAGSLDQATVVAIQGRYKNLLPRLFILLLIISQFFCFWVSSLTHLFIQCSRMVFCCCYRSFIRWLIIVPCARESCTFFLAFNDKEIILTQVTVTSQSGIVFR